MTSPQYAGTICDELDKSLRSSEVNLSRLVGSLVEVIREQAWRERRIRTGEIVQCESFLDMLTATPLRGFGEDPHKVEALLRDDPDALRMFREATTAPNHRPRSNDNVSSNRTVKHGNARAYTLDRLHREAPELYARVVAKELSPHRAAILAGFRKVKTPLEHLTYWWAKANREERTAALAAFRDGDA